MQYENNAIYEIKHTRKGNFKIKVIDRCEEWLTREIVQGKTAALLDYNVKEKGEKETIRKCLISSSKKIMQLV